MEPSDFGRSHLAELGREGFWLEMGVSTKHRQTLVPGDAGHFERMQALLEEARRRFVAQVMPSKVLDAQVLQCPLPDAAQGIGRRGQDGAGGRGQK